MEKKLSAVISMADLPALREQCMRGGRRIVSTNGCFDLLHAGHIQMLSEAKSLGDVLVVGLNDDASVTALKGPTRPLVRQDDRAAILANLRCVDHVVIFGGLLPTEMLELLRPDVHCKAADYSAESLPEAEIVRRHGGRVAILSLRKGYGTSDILAKAVSGAAGGAGKPASDQSQPGNTAGDITSWVISDMLASANVHRQLAYQLSTRSPRRPRPSRPPERRAAPCASRWRGCPRKSRPHVKMPLPR